VIHIGPLARGATQRLGYAIMSPRRVVFWRSSTALPKVVGILEAGGGCGSTGGRWPR
jgi:hypothetical protein